MGKKRVAAPTKTELLKEREIIEAKEAKLQKEEGKTSSAIKEGKLYICSSYNNTILTLTDKKGHACIG